MGEAKRRREYDFSNILPNHALPEDIPVLIRKTAMDIAGTYFDDEVNAAIESQWSADRRRSEMFRARWKDQRSYVALNWGSFVPIARTVLTSMLQDATVSETYKQAIYEAFLEQAKDKRLLDMGEHLVANAVN